MNTLKHRATAKTIRTDDSYELESAAEQGKGMELETGGRKKEQKSGSNGLISVVVVICMVAMLFYLIDMNGSTSVGRNEVSSMKNVNAHIQESSHQTQLQQQWQQWHKKREEDDNDDKGREEENNNNGKEGKKYDNEKKSKGFHVRPLIVVVDGCSGSSAVGYFLRKIAAAHGMNSSGPDIFEFFYFGRSSTTNELKNPFFHEIQDRDESLGLHRSKHQMMIESVEVALRTFNEANELLIVKAKVNQYKRYHEGLDYLNPTYYGVYRENTLRKCICMIKDDCFFPKYKDAGYPVFAQNGTKSNVCSQRRDIPNLHIQIMLKNVTHCVVENSNSELMELPIPKISEEELFLFEYSDDEDVFMDCVKRWSNILEMNWSPSGIVVREEIIIQTLRPHQNTRTFKPYQDEVYNYDEIKDDLLQMGLVEK
jgi:hypothetical protein